MCSESKKTIKDELKKISVDTAKPHTKLSFITTLRFPGTYFRSKISFSIITGKGYREQKLI